MKAHFGRRYQILEGFVVPLGALERGRYRAVGGRVG